MKQALYSLLAFGSIMLAACGSSVDINQTSSTGMGTGGSDPGTSSSTSTSTTSSSSSGTGGSVPCQPEVTVTVTDAANGNVVLGTTGFRTLSVTLAVSNCVGLEVNLMDFQLVSIVGDSGDQTPFCADPCSPGTWNFENVKVNSHVGGNTLMGPIEFKAMASNQPALAHFTDTFLLTAGSTVQVDIKLDVT